MGPAISTPDHARMPITLETVGEILVARFHGRITSEDMLTGGRDVLAIEQAKETTPSRLIDLSEVTTIDLDFGSMLEFANLRATTVFKNPARSAIVAPGPVHFGFARMYQTLNRNQL